MVCNTSENSNRKTKQGWFACITILESLSHFCKHVLVMFLGSFHNITFRPIQSNDNLLNRRILCLKIQKCPYFMLWRRNVHVYTCMEESCSLPDYNNNTLVLRFRETAMFLNLNFKIVSFRYVPTDIYTPIE